MRERLIFRIRIFRALSRVTIYFKNQERERVKREFDESREIVLAVCRVCLIEASLERGEREARRDAGDAPREPQIAARARAAPAAGAGRGRES